MIDLNTILTPGTSISVVPGTHSPLPVQLSGTLVVTKINIADGLKQTISYTDSSVYYRDIFPARGVVGEWVCDSFGSITDWKDLNLVPTEFSSRWPTFAEVTQKPSTLAGFGITDAFKKSGGEINGLISVIDGQNIELKQSSTGTYNSIKFLGSDLSLKSKIQYVNGSLDLGSSVTVQGAVLVNAAQSTAVNSLTRRDYVDSSLSTGLNTKLNLTGGTLSNTLNISLNSASSMLLTLTNETDGWTWIRLGKAAGANQGHFAWNTQAYDGHPANAFHFRPAGGTAGTVLSVSTGAASIRSDSVLDFLGNSTWGGTLRIGGNGRTVTGVLAASVVTTNGNLHLDSGTDKAAYINYYSGTAGIRFGNGNQSIVGTIDSSGNMSMNGTITAPTFTGALTGTASNADKLDNIDSKGFGRAYSSWVDFGGSQTACTTADFITLLTNMGAFSQPYWVAKGSWSYAANYYITDTGCGIIQLAGATVEVIGSTSAYTIRIHTAPTTSAGGVTNADFVYVNHGSGYAPMWHRMYSTFNKPSASDVGALSLANGGTVAGAVTVTNSFSADNIWTNRIATVGTGNDYSSGGVELRGNGSSNTIFPTLGFHQPGLYAGSIQQRNANDFYLFKQGATTKANLYTATNISESLAITGAYGSQIGGFQQTGTGNNTRLWGLGHIFMTAPSGYVSAQCSNAYYDGTNWLKYNNAAASRVLEIGNDYLQLLHSNPGETTAAARRYDLWHEGNFDPATKLDNNGSGGTLTLSNWFRSTGATGWYNATYGGGICMSDTTWVKVSHSKQFYVDNAAVDSIRTAGGVTAAVSMTAPTFNGDLNGNASTASNASWASALSTIDVNPVNRLNSGSYQNSAATIANGWPVTTNTWMHLLSSTHSNGSNYYAMQFAASFYNNTQLYYRSTNGNGATGWAQVWTSAVFDPNTKANLSGATFTGNVTAPTYNGLALNSSNAASTIAVRDSSGDLQCRLLRPEYQNQSDIYGAIAFRGASGSGTDNYVRFCSEPSAVRDWIGAPSTALATNATSGLMSAADKFKLDNIQRSKSTQETTLWSGEAGSSTSTISISESLYNYNAIRYQGTNADRSICWTLTMPAHEWAAQVATGKIVSIEAGAYYFAFAAPGLNSTTLTRSTNNCYLTKITGLK